MDETIRVRHLSTNPRSGCDDPYCRWCGNGPPARFTSGANGLVDAFARPGRVPPAARVRPRVLDPVSQPEDAFTTGVTFGLDETFVGHVRNQFRGLEILLLKKHADYGPTNIANAPGGALNGIRVRLWDKMSRLNHLMENASFHSPENESLRDTWADLANYAIIALLVTDGHWPGC